MKEITPHLFGFDEDATASENYLQSLFRRGIHARLVKQKDMWFVWSSGLQKKVVENIYRYGNISFQFTTAWMIVHSTTDVDEAISYALANLSNIQCIHVINMGVKGDEMYVVADRLSPETFIAQYKKRGGENIIGLRV